MELHDGGQVRLVDYELSSELEEVEEDGIENEGGETADKVATKCEDGIVVAHVKNEVSIYIYSNTF